VRRTEPGARATITIACPPVTAKLGVATITGAGSAASTDRGSATGGLGHFERGVPDRAKYGPWLASSRSLPGGRVCGAADGVARCGAPAVAVARRVRVRQDRGVADLEVLAEDARAADEVIERLERAGVPDADELVSLVAGFRGVVMQLVDEVGAFEV